MHRGHQTSGYGPRLVHEAIEKRRARWEECEQYYTITCYVDAGVPELGVRYVNNI